ncbi:MAG: diguanylate cyclase [Prochloraceae cyanobacterium]
MLLTNKDLSIVLEKQLAELSSDTKPLSNSKAMGKILEAIGEALDWQVGALWIVDKNFNLLKCKEVWQTQLQQVQEFTLITRQLTLTPGCDLPGYVWQSQELGWVTDLSKDRNSPRRLQAVEVGLKGGFCLPLKNDAEVVGVLEFFSYNTFNPDKILLETITELSITISESLKSIFDRVDEDLIFADKNNNLALVKSAAEPMLVNQENILFSQDRLTGLANRELFLKHLSNAVTRTQQQKEYFFAVLLLNLDRFKVINHTLGYAIGDQLLIAVARKIETCLRSEDIIARLGDDEFAILLENMKAPNCAVNIAERIGKELTSPFNLNGHKVFANASIGIALSTTNYDRPEEILRQADTAMSHAKMLGKAGYQIFNDLIHLPTIELLKLENELQRAIERQELKLHYQPIVSLQTRRITGFEVLVRWQHPERGLIAPSEFITLAEETGLIIPLGTWVLREACRQIRLWQVQFPDFPLFLSVNVSAKELSQVSFIEQVKQIVRETGLDPHSLKLEFTESILLENTESVITAFKELQDIGIQFSLDDFGTGYSCLSYLHQFPFNTLKIDRSFIESINLSSEKLGIVRTIVTLAANLGMDVVAEGIEQGNQLAQLKVLKCQYGQGYFFSKPLDSKAAEALMVAQFVDGDQVNTDNPKVILEEKLSREQLLVHIEKLSQELEDLKQERTDLEILLETTTEHAEIVESELQKEINNYQQAEACLLVVNKELESLSLLDSLTQVANRRYFDDYLNQEWQTLAAKERPLSLILADVDYFKRYNDEYGHQQGDDCLIQVAQAMSRPVKPQADLVARYGGEEFAVILPNSGAEGALKIAEAIRWELKKLKIPHAQSSVSAYVTLSLGVVSMIPTTEDSIKRLIALADKALYEAKNQGRDRFILFSS